MFTSWKTSAPLNSLVTSDAETIGVRQQLTVDNGQLVKNGVEVGATSLFEAGDIAEIKVYSSAAASTPVFVNVVAGTSKYIFGVISADEPVLVTDGRYVNMRAVDFQYYPDGTEFFPDTDNELVTEARSTNLFTPAAETAVGTHLLVFLDYFNHRVMFLAPETGGLVFSIDTELTEAGLFSIAAGSKFAFCTGSQIVVINTATWEMSAFLSQAQVCSSDANYVYSANEALRWTHTFAGQVVSVTGSGKRPTAVLGAYTSYFDGTVADGLFTFQAPTAIRAMARNSSNLFVVYGDTVARLTHNLLLVDTYSAAHLSAVSVCATETRVVVGCFNDSVIVFDTALNVLDTQVVDSPYGVAFIDQWYAASCYKQHPQAIYHADRIPAPFDLSDKFDLGNHLSTSNQVLVTGIVEGQITAFTHEATLLVNDVLSGTSAQVRAGDRVAVRVLSAPTVGQSVIAPLTIGQQYSTYVVTSLSQDILPDYFEFVPAVSAIGSPVQSNSVTVTGIATDITVSLSSGQLLVNGIITTYPVLVSAGSTLAIRTTVGAAAKIVTMTAGSFKADFVVSPPTFDATYYLDDSHYLTDEQGFGETGADTTNTVARYSSYLTFKDRINFSAPTNTTINKQAVGLVVDRTNSKVYTVDAYAFAHNKTLSLPNIVAADWAPKRPNGNAVQLMVATESEVRSYDRNFILLWTKTFGYSDIVDICFYNLSTLLVMRRYVVEVWNVVLSSGQFTLADTILFEGTHFSYNSTEGYVEILLMCGKSGIKQFLGPSYQIKATTAVATDSRMYTFDRYENDLIVFENGVELHRKKQTFPVGDMCLLAGTLFVIDLKNKRLVKFSTSLEQVSAISINNTVDLMIWDSYLWLYEKLSNVVDRTAQNTLQLTVPNKVDCEAGQPVSVTVIPTTLRAFPVQISPSFGLELSVNGQPTTTVVGGQPLTVTATASETPLAKRRVCILGAEPIFWNLTTAPQTVPDQMTFCTIYDAFPSIIVESEPNTVSGLSDGYDATLRLDAPDYVLNINGQDVGQEATVVNGDIVVLRIRPEMAFGSVTTFRLYAGTTEIGSQRIVAQVLGKAIKRPPIIPHYRNTGHSVEEYRASPQSEVPLQLPEYAASSNLSAINNVADYRPSLVLDAVASSSVFDMARQYVASALDSFINKNVVLATVGRATSVFDSHAIYRTAASRSRSTSQPIYRAAASRSRSTSHPVFNTLAVKSLIRPSPTALRTAKVSSVLGAPRTQVLNNSGRPTSLSTTTFGIFAFDYQFAASRSSLVQQSWIKHLYYAADSHCQQPAKFLPPTSAVISSYFTKASAVWSPVRTTWQRHVSWTATRRQYFDRYATDSFSTSVGWAAALDQTIATSSILYKVFRRAAVLLDQIYFIPSAATHFHQLAHQRPQLESFYPVFSARSTSIKHVGNLFTVQKNAIALSADALFEEPVIIDMAVRGLFDTAAQALADSSSAINPVTVVPFKSKYFWNQRPTIENKVCLTISGFGSRTPYKWNMQMATVVSPAKKSWYMGGG